MGLTNVALTITSIENPKKKLEGEFLVDSGAVYTVLPKKYVHKLHIKPRFKQKFSLADGSIVTRDVGDAFITFKGKRVPSPVILGKENDSPLLGVLTLEAMGYVLNPFDRKLYPAKLMM